MRIREFLKKYPLIIVFASLLVVVWIVYGIYEYFYNKSNDENQREFEELAAAAFSTSENQAVSDNESVSEASVSDDAIDEGPTEEELRAIALEERNKRIQAFYEICGDEEYYRTYLEAMPDFNALIEKNDDVVGYLLIPDTKIDYPILQSEDNGFYLDHNMKKKKSHTGCLYIENYNYLDMQDPIAIIYGHDMLNDSMFGTLNKYLEAGYRKKHKYFFVYSFDESQVYEVAITSVVEDTHLFNVTEDFVEESDGTVMFYGFNGNEPELLYNAFKNKTLSHSNTYITSEPFKEGDQLMILSTCFRPGTRFIVVGKRVV